MSDKNSLLSASACPDEDALIRDDVAPYIQIGQFYWVKSSGGHNDEATGEYVNGDFEWLGCAMEIGSNYVLLQEPSYRSYYSRRVLLSEVFEVLRHEPNFEQVIKDKIEFCQSQAKAHLEAVKSITARLGVSPQLALSKASANSPGTALSIVSGTQDIKAYEASLIRAEKEELPALFEAIKVSTAKVAKWMSAEMLPMMAQAKIMEGSIGEIKDRIFNVSLYAGLIEQIAQCQSGEPAAFHEKLRVMQRILFMDEECLLNYRVGGMEFKDIAAFDEWMCEPDNFNRILPFQRCMVAMRVRRNPKKRDWQGSIQILMNNIENAYSDKWTYLYIRNGENLYRLGSNSFEFDAGGNFIFPDKSVFNPSEPMMVKKSGSREFEMITVSDFESREQEHEERIKNFHQWNKDHPFSEWAKTCDQDEVRHGEPRLQFLYNDANPYRGWNQYGKFNAKDWHPFNDSYIYYDDAVEIVANRIKTHNRIALLIQGLFDRSETLHPHPPVKIWEPAGFAASVELVYDGSVTLYSGQKPDIDAYLSKCNESLNADSVVIGQELFWLKKEAEKECARRDRDWRDKNEYRPEIYRPHGNEGPGYLAKISEFKKRSGKAVFVWNRTRLSDFSYGGKIKTSITVPLTELFNVSAYTPGDFKQFFNDPRTREEYLKWAPMLIAAEEFCAGNAVVQEPIKE